MATPMHPPITRATHRLDATHQPLGRLATHIANLLRGKGKPAFTHHLDSGDQVVVVHARQIRLTGRKADQKVYYTHTGFPGHLKSRSVREVLAKQPEQMLVHAVVGMLPKNRLQKHWLKRLVIWPDEAPHQIDTSLKQGKVGATDGD